VLDTIPPPGRQLQTIPGAGGAGGALAARPPNPALVAAITRYQALREFRAWLVRISAAGKSWCRAEVQGSRFFR
jgi:hypothetical protein